MLPGHQESDRLRDLILKHSAFVGFPIELLMERVASRVPVR